MRVQTFLGKVTVESLHQMDQHINAWLESHAIQPKHITQSIGYEKMKEGGSAEPVVVTSIWY